MKINSLSDLEAVKNDFLTKEKEYLYTAHICYGAGCLSSDCKDFKDAFLKALEDEKLQTKVRINLTGCMGACTLGPTLIINPGNILYCNLNPASASQIVDEHIRKGKIADRYCYKNPETGKPIPKLSDIPFFKHQKKIVLEKCGLIDFGSLEEYIAHDGYFALAKVLGSMSQAEVINEIKQSGLRGRGGGGFPTGLKWEMANKEANEQKYIICNADEGDPGAFMDRSLLEGDAHSVIEGLVIGGYAIGASKGVVYIRAEYPVAIERLKIAIKLARACGLLGETILGSQFGFDVDIRIGAGAFVCGEETALMESVEGKRGEPRQKPPYPVQRGLFGRPTVINNVETLGNVAQIILKGSDWFSSIGTEKSKGTKVFALAGDVVNKGLIEVPMGTTLGEIIYEVGGGIPRGKLFKMAQTGGPSGGCLTPAHLNTPIDYDSLTQLGAIMGSGGLIVADEDTCMVDIARFFMDFVQDESCGKCVPCRIGTKRMLEILERITRGEGKEGDIEILMELGGSIKDAAICGLGQTAPNPVLSTINHFRKEYDEHIRQHYCRAGVCSDLFLSPCQNACPAGVNVPGYVALIAAGRVRDAYNLIRQENPFPSICGRVCTHPCESKCRRGQLDEPIAIADLKRYAADFVLNSDEPFMSFNFHKNGKSVGIIGAGPSGLTCGYYLSRLGYAVDIYEEKPVAGGILAYGIPEYRLPKSELKKEIDSIIQSGINIIYNTKVGKDISFSELKSTYNAVYIATGTQLSRKIGIEGEELSGVYHGLDFLRDINMKKNVEVKGVIAVIGGGSTAIDAARSAVRLGARKVMILYRRTREEMPADKREIEDAIEEGVVLQELTAPVRFIGYGQVSTVECVRMMPGKFGKDGRRVPVEVPDSNFMIDIDMAIPAVSQYSDLPFLSKAEVGITDWGTFIVDPYTQMTTQPGVFAGGDIARGSDVVITAIADGKNAAKSIDKYLGGKGLLNIGDPIEIPSRGIDEETTVEHERFKMRCLDPEQRRGNFEEVQQGFHKLNAIAEAMRCLQCSKRK
ncbi:MAG: NADH-ubiquinone oxidoreductase-F iron-sulfur binding region domain-containing protein [Bacteroidota bacterium]|nr:NADH-ubiquinone oxidoreductase-F iron-sulfur binding region domain-containing protein [Bacteroidota bacterium]